MNKHLKTILMSALLLTGAASIFASQETGKPAADFSLTDTYGQTRKLSDYNGKFVVLEWFNPDCPFVKKHYDSGSMQALQKEYTGQGVVWLSINSSAGGKQGNLIPKPTMN